MAAVRLMQFGECFLRVSVGEGFLREQTGSQVKKYFFVFCCGSEDNKILVKTESGV